jgi:hypothetical protein
MESAGDRPGLARSWGHSLLIGCSPEYTIGDFARWRSFFTMNQHALSNYKYNRAHFNFSNSLDPSQGVGTGLKGDHEAHAMVVGLAYHFQ